MEEIYLRDRGGIQPDTEDMITDDLVTYLDGMNTTLGGKEDPRFGEYQNFLSSISEASILKIEPDQMSSGKFDDLDLTADDEDVDVIKDLPNDKFFDIKNESDEELVKVLMLQRMFTPFTEGGMNVDKDYVPVFKEDLMLPVFKDA